MDAYAFPSSFAQQRLWFLDRLTPRTSLYNIPAALRLDHPLDPACLERCVNELARRHETLRTTFRDVDGEPMQMIATQQDFAVGVTDLRGMPEEGREAEALRLAGEEARRPFDLQCGPLLRVGLLQLSEREQVLLVTTHHIISDGWSMEVFFRELAALYEAFHKGLPSPLPELPVQYADYAVWQREWLRGEVLATQLRYWKEKLADLTALRLPADHARPPIASYAGSREFLRIDEATTAALKQFSQRENATLFMTLLAAFQALLYRYTGQEDIAVGTLAAGRNRAETEGLIGFFVNTLVLRTDVGGNPRFRELVGRVKETALGAYGHADLPFEKLVEEMQPERDLSRNPLVQVTFQLFNPPKFGEGPVDADGSSGEEAPRLLEVAKDTAKFDLALEMWESGSALEGRMEYNTDLFEAATVRRMLGHFRRLLRGAAETPDEHIGALPMLSEAERERPIVEWNRTARDYPRDRCVHEIFEAQAENNPRAAALICGGETWTCRELNQRADGIARHLRALGVGPETTVGVCLPRIPPLVAALIGVLKAGGAYVPLDPQYPVERLEFMVADARCAVVIADDLAAPALSRTGARVADIREMGGGPACAGDRAAPHNLAYVLYTSGSTGQPKGVAIEHRNAVALIGWAHDFYSRDDLRGVLASTSVCFDLSVFELFVPLCCGGTVILVDSALELPQAPARNRVTLINTVPSAIAELAAAGAIPDSVRTLNLAGEPLRAELVDDVFSSSAVGRIFNLYGPTEDTTYSTCARIERGGKWAPSIGRPIANRKAYILDSRMTPVPPGVTGELFLGGGGVARGYVNRPELNAAKFLPSPFVPGTRLYRTGDLARYRENGEIEFLGRSDYQVKLRGYRIELGEIEAALRASPEIRDAVVVMRDDGRSGPALAAYAVPRPGCNVEEVRVRQFLQQRLPPYMVPSTVELMDRLPLTPNGKVDRKALPAREAGRTPGHTPRAAPRTELERSIAGIWKEVLAVPEVGINDNFFELGGHSLLLLRLQSRLAAVVGQVPVVDLFRYPTVEALARHLADGRGQEPDGMAAARQRAEKQKSRARERGKNAGAGGGGAAPWTARG